MKPLIIEAQIDSPEVMLDPNTNIFSISGISHPENAKEFYQRIQDWLDMYFEEKRNNKPNKIVIDLSFKYLNSSSYKFLQEILRKISRYTTNQITVEVIWNYHEEDEDIHNEGIILLELPDVMLPYRCVPYS